MKQKAKIYEADCKRCQYEWNPRVPDPKVCPKCGSRHWAEPKEVKP